MTYQQVEKSNPAYTPAHTTFLTVHSKALAGRGNISVYHPTPANKADLPLVVLLHGVYGNNWVWMNLGGVHHVYDRLKADSKLGDMILVMPSDGNYYAGSAYLPIQEDGAQPNRNFESWIIDDVIDTTIDSIDGATQDSNVYLCGLSMGGYGALRLGCKHPRRFQGISAHSSITQLNEMSLFVSEPLGLYQCKNPREADILYWVDKHKEILPPLQFDCGEDDSLLAGNKILHAELKKRSIPHRFSTYPGAHSWDYWHTRVADSLLFFNRLENTNNPKTSP